MTFTCIVYTPAGTVYLLSKIDSPMDISWTLLIASGLMEPCWVYTLERSDSFKRLTWALATALIVMVNLWMLSQAMMEIGAGIAYAVWAGIGAVCTFLLGVLVYKDPFTLKRTLFIAFIIAGIVGLHSISRGA